MVDPFGICAEKGWHVLSAITGYAEGASMMYVGLEKIGFGVGMLGAGPVGWVVGAGFIMWGMFDTVCGASDIYEASQHTVMAISGENWKAVNPICDTFFDDDKVLYSMVETTSIAFTGPAMHEAYMNGEMTTKEFVDWYNNPANYRPELPGNNRSHRYE